MASEQLVYESRRSFVLHDMVLPVVAASSYMRPASPYMTPSLTAAPLHRKPVGNQKHAQKTCHRALEKSQQAAVSVSPSAPCPVCWLVASRWS